MVTMKKYINFLFAALLLGTSCTIAKTKCDNVKNEM